MGIGILVLLLGVASVGQGIVHPAWAPNSTRVMGPSDLAFASSSPAYDYDNLTYHLVNYDPLTAYVNSRPGYQYPTLSSDPAQAAGIYYVQNETDGSYPFVEQSIATNMVTPIAHIIPLYQKFAGYAAMIDNEFFLEYGYDVALFFGTTTPTGTHYSLELVNLTTGSFSMWNTTWGTSPSNQQAQYLGNDVVAVISSNGSVEGFNLSSHQSWSMTSTRLPFFEANNLYWLPQMDQFLNVEAEGSAADVVELWAENPSAEPTFSLEQTYTWGSHITVNGVNGVGFNVSYSSGRPGVVFSTGNGAGVLTNVVLTYASSIPGPTDTISGSNDSGNCNDGTKTAGLLAEQYVYTSSYFLCWAPEDNLLHNVWDPWNNSYLTTNITPVTPKTCDNACFEGTYAPTSAYLLNFNATAILAGGPTNPPYDVVYDYQNASDPQFTPAFGPTGLRVGHVTTTSIPLSWINPQGTLLNDTVYQGPSCGIYSTNVSLGNATTSYLVVGLAPATSYCFAVSSWNATGQSPLSAPVVGTTLPDAPSALTLTAVTETTASLTWKNPSGSLVNDTLFWSPGSCGSFSHAVSTDGATTSATVTGLTQGTRYCITVEAWSAGGNSSGSNAVNLLTSQVPGAPTGLTAVHTSTTSVALTWTNPVGDGLLNDTVYQGTSCGEYTIRNSLGISGSAYTATGLASATAYCFAVSAWNSTGESPLSSTVIDTTLPTAPSDLKVSAYNFTSISLTWSNPNGTLVNDTVYWTSGSCGSYSDAASLGGAGTTYTIAGLKAGAVYCIAVVAWSAAGPSVLSLAISQKTRTATEPVSPWRIVWPPVFGLPDLGPFNWVGLAFVALGSIFLAGYRRRTIGPVLIGAGAILLFLIAL